MTELGGQLASRAQLMRACSRYYFAAEFCHGKDLLEVACGGGQGLGYLARFARKPVVGLDIDPVNLAVARETYRGRDDVRVVEGDAHALPFPDASFDVVVVFEAIYYLRDPERFVAEVRRVLRPGGVLIMCTLNKDLPDFDPGPFTHRHFGPAELSALLRPAGFAVEVLGASPIPRTWSTRTLRLIKGAAVRLRLIPRSLKARAPLKRLIFGPLVPLPYEIREGMAAYDQPVRVPLTSTTTDYLVLFCVGTLAGDPPHAGTPGS